MLVAVPATAKRARHAFPPRDGSVLFALDRRHLSSHVCKQTRAQTDANGFFSQCRRSASAYRFSPMRETKPGTSMPADLVQLLATARDVCKAKAGCAPGPSQAKGSTP